MRYYYISEKAGNSGISKYARDFYELVLKEKGYEFVDAGEPAASIMAGISPEDRVHFELGIFQTRELKILFVLLKNGYENIAVTLHDPPLLKYPYYSFRNGLLNKVSKFYDIHISGFRESRKYIRKIKFIYVLSQKGFQAVQHRYKTSNVFYLPHIINEKEVCRNSAAAGNFIYLGFIGRNKGIEYALQLHQALLTEYPDSKFYIAGTAMGSEKKFYESLKVAYTKNVYFLDYVTEDRLSELFRVASFSFILFKEYRFFCPVSGSVLYNLKKGNIVFTNRANAIPEIVRDGKNGFYLSGNMYNDLRIISTVMTNVFLQDRVMEFSYHHLLMNHSKSAVVRSLQC